MMEPTARVAALLASSKVSGAGSEVQSYGVHLNLLQWCGYTDLILDALKQLGDINQR